MQSLKKQTSARSCRHSACGSEVRRFKVGKCRQRHLQPFKGVGGTRKGQAKKGGMLSPGLASMQIGRNTLAPNTRCSVHVASQRKALRSPNSLSTQQSPNGGKPSILHSSLLLAAGRLVIFVFELVSQCLCIVSHRVRMLRHSALIMGRDLVYRHELGAFRLFDLSSQSRLCEMGTADFCSKCSKAARSLADQV